MGDQLAFDGTAILNPNGVAARARHFDGLLARCFKESSFFAEGSENGADGRDEAKNAKDDQEQGKDHPEAFRHGGCFPARGRASTEFVLAMILASLEKVFVGSVPEGEWLLEEGEF